MKTLITGATGFIGRNFLEAFRDQDTLGLGFSRQGKTTRALDLRDRDATISCLREYKPFIVIHCAARPTVDWCEGNEAAAYALNVVPTVTLAEGCAELGARLVFLSSDYVFDGAAGPYDEEAATNPINVYGRQKLNAENEIRTRLDDHLIVRTTNVFGYDRRSKNFLMPLLPRLARGERVRVASDQFGNPTLVEDFCQAVKHLVISGAQGTFHVVGPDWVNRVVWLRAAAQAFDLNPDLVAGVLTEELNQPAPRPRKSGLASVRLEDAIGRRLAGLREGLEVMRARWGGDVPIAEW